MSLVYLSPNIVWDWERADWVMADVGCRLVGGRQSLGLILVVGKKSGSRGRRQSIVRDESRMSREFAKSIQTQLVSTRGRVCWMLNFQLCNLSSATAVDVADAVSPHTVSTSSLTQLHDPSPLPWMLSTTRVLNYCGCPHLNQRQRG